MSHHDVLHDRREMTVAPWSEEKEKPICNTWERQLLAPCPEEEGMPRLMDLVLVPRDKIK